MQVEFFKLGICILFFFFFKQKTAYEIKECDWSSDVCSSDLLPKGPDLTEFAASIIFSVVSEVI